MCKSYGGPDVVEIREVPSPTPKDHEILIRVRATTVSAGDARIRAARFPSGFALPARLALGLFAPRKPILGTELSGVVERTGRHVTRFAPGDEVIAMTGFAFAAHAEEATLPESGAVILKPPGLAFEDAASLPFGGTTALYFLRDIAQLKPGERVLINGASGAVGSAAVQLARHMGANVTAVCSSAHVPLVCSLGADSVIDYTATDFATCGETFDVLFDAVGNAGFKRCRHLLKSRGRLLLAVAGLMDLLKAPVQSLRSGLKVAGGTAPERAADLEELARLSSDGVFRPVIGERFPFGRIADAHTHVDTGHKTGSTVILMDRS